MTVAFDIAWTAVNFALAGLTIWTAIRGLRMYRRRLEMYSELLDRLKRFAHLYRSSAPELAALVDSEVNLVIAKVLSFPRDWRTFLKEMFGR